MLSEFPPRFPPTKSESKIVPLPFVPPSWVPPLFVAPSIDLQYSSFPPTKIFNLCVTDLPKLTTYTLSTCVISFNTNEQKQGSRSKLIFEIHKQTRSVHNHLPNFSKQLTKE